MIDTTMMIAEKMHFDMILKENLYFFDSIPELINVPHANTKYCPLEGNVGSFSFLIRKIMAIDMTAT